MRKLLLIDCCIRKEQSQTRRLMEAFLHAVPADCAVERLVLTEENLAPLTGDFFAQRQRLLESRDYAHPRFRYAKQFAQADLVVIAAPFWDLAFPALLAFPAYYGKNLDALHDCLTDLSDPVHLTVLHAQALEDALGAYCRSFQRVLSDSAQENEHFTLTWEE